MGRVITTQDVASAAEFVLARKSGSSKGQRRSETAQAVASAGKFVPAREHCKSCSIGGEIRACQKLWVE